MAYTPAAAPAADSLYSRVDMRPFQNDVSGSYTPTGPLLIDKASNDAYNGRQVTWKRNAINFSVLAILAGLTIGLAVAGHKTGNVKMMYGAIAPGAVFLIVGGMTIRHKVAMRKRANEEYEPLLQ